MCREDKSNQFSGEEVADMTRRGKSIVIMVLVVFMFPFEALAAVTLMWLDTSGSMNKGGRFESARDVLIREIRESKPGDVLYIGNFDTNDYLIGRLAVDESGSNEEKEKLINKVRSLRAKGQWTNLDEPLQASKATLLEERTPGNRKIVILSDGLSDPSPDHQVVDLEKVAEIVPQSLGWSLYLIGLSEDIEGLFQAKSSESQLTVNQQYPHVKGIPLKDFTHAKIENAVETVKKDSMEVVTNSEPTSEQAALKPRRAPWALILSAFALAAVSVPLLLVHRSKNQQKLPLVLEIRGTDGESKEIQVLIEEGKKKTAGPKGEIPIEDRGLELPSVIFSIQWEKGSLWLLPQDSITVNGKLINDKVNIGVGDRIKVRDKLTILVKEGGDNGTD